MIGISSRKSFVIEDRFRISFNACSSAAFTISSSGSALSSPSRFYAVLSSYNAIAFFLLVIPNAIDDSLLCRCFFLMRLILFQKMGECFLFTICPTGVACEQFSPTMSTQVLGVITFNSQVV